VRNRIWIVLLVVSLGVNIGFLLHWTWPKFAAGRAGGASSGWHAGPMKRSLGLSSDQARLLENARRQVMAQAKPLQDELRLKRRELLDLLKEKTVADAELDVVLSEISRLQADIEKLFIRHSLQMRSLFSPGQLRKYEGYLEKGLCPNRMSDSSCSPGRRPGRRSADSGCAGRGDAKK
jgi:Spy/CpxP family protein refolding chaperone